MLESLTPTKPANLYIYSIKFYFIHIINSSYCANLLKVLGGCRVDKQKADNPIFVIGTPRSGTTLTARILDRHSRIFMPGETHYFDDIYSRRHEIGEFQSSGARSKVLERLLTLYERYNEPPDQRRINHLFANTAARNALITPKDNYCAVLSRFMEIQMAHEGKARWGNNAPRDVFNIKDVLQCYPKAKIIVCVRDVRDFLVSYKNKWKITSTANTERLKALYHPVITSLLWKSSMRQIPIIKSVVAAQNLMVLRYEYLVQNPHRAVQEICAFVDEDYEPDMLNVDTHNSSVQLGGTGIFSSSIGTWRSTLSHEEAFIAQRLNRKELHDLGYAAEKLQGNKLTILRYLLSAPVAACRALYANKAMRGSVTVYLYRRLASFFS